MAAKKKPAAKPKAPAKKPPAKAAKAAAPASRAARPTLEIKAVSAPPRTIAPSKLAAPPPGPPTPPPVDHAARVGELWRRLETWVASTGAPALALNAGASEKAIAAAEKTMKLGFPPDFRASLAVHDGQSTEGGAGGAQVFPWMPGCPPLLPLARVVERWKEEQDFAAKRQPKKEWFDAGGKLKGGVYRTGRIPIAGPVRREGERTFLDFDPGPAGARGQLITMVSASDFVVIDASFAAAFERWVNVLERGLWIYDTAMHTVHPRALAPATSHPSGLFSKR